MEKSTVISLCLGELVSSSKLAGLEPRLVATWAGRIETLNTAKELISSPSNEDHKKALLIIAAVQAAIRAVLVLDAAPANDKLIDILLECDLIKYDRTSLLFSWTDKN